MKPPQTEYAKVGDQLVAYQVVGDAPIDLVYASGFGAVEPLWDHPIPARFLERLSTFARLILFDPRGWGASDRFGPDRFPTWEDWAEDMHAVFDAVGSTRAAVMSSAMATPLALIFAATKPERISALILFNSVAKWIASADYPWGLPSIEAADAVASWMEKMWGKEELVTATQPSVAGDPKYREWNGKALRASGSPRMGAAMMRYMHRFDARGLLPLIQAPTLVLHRLDTPFIVIDHGRYLAEHIPDARLIGVPGADENPYTDEIAGHIEEFLTGVKRAPEPDRVLATVLFTDIVGSTERAAQLGDATWKKLLDRHDDITRAHLEAHRGRLVNWTGDGMLATFDGPARAIRCAAALRDELRANDVEIRAGLHTGEVELRGGDVGGIAVHIGARVMSHAAAGEILVSGSVPPLVVGSGIEFDDRGEHSLKGVPGEWRLLAVRI